MSSLFAWKLSGQHHCIEVDECEDVESYVETVGLMYCKELNKRLIKHSVSQVLGILKVMTTLIFIFFFFFLIQYLVVIMSDLTNNFVMVEILLATFVGCRATRVRVMHGVMLTAYITSRRSHG
ncbi:putative BTB/POZ domain-containing protein [Helianthus annuus]|nr:putative BTB/POZ domain-containing protein [Helianthus annuus]KAJ0474556.1 putative BTB/POZ domain-containing protein [Helianthus annuus]KAJ0650113.1 putative BTB/POZ domain-containing protein [Helianthus annuus]KAJ0653885.1 putative BTB/POZ domain-containing protein [Helianthus annuus]